MGKWKWEDWFVPIGVVQSLFVFRESILYDWKLIISPPIIENPATEFVFNHKRPI